MQNLVKRGLRWIRRAAIRPRYRLCYKHKQNLYSPHRHNFYRKHRHK